MWKIVCSYRASKIIILLFTRVVKIYQMLKSNFGKNFHDKDLNFTKTVDLHSSFLLFTRLL